ncbi:hypothetical protein HYFRA_00009556 [Hymenoscyphus fraxineus]|uniref:MutL C-terminal dimerisation domain-containing protein n=1 Tax=Hymenoscyphus fraxineus TaxID=746836 RepID=A0A9N9L204_9HELO|nr:hypothetical protein HYFRA_00009556 [Hymenoscyphus fraxineus]
MQPAQYVHETPIMSIQPLPPAVIAQIKSSIVITSLNAVICELAKNSLDAGSTKLDISVDYAKGGCVVEDNGVGIPPSEFRDGGGLGMLHHSSKLNSNTLLHGRKGAFLASLAAVALLTITSHHHKHHSHNSVGMHKSQVISRQTPTPSHQHLFNTEHGTRVTVRDLFGNMPVRVKQRAISAEKYRGNNKDWEELKRSIALLLLSWPEPVAVTVREVGTLQKIVIRLPPAPPNKKPSNPKVCSILSQAAIVNPDETSSWVEVSASTEQLKVWGSISLDPSATKNVQFLSFGIQPLLPADTQSIIHVEINRLFANSAFGNEDEVEELDDSERQRRKNDARYKSDAYTNRELKGVKKGVEKWPMFYINIRQRTASQASQGLEVDDVLDDKGSNLGIILELLQAMISEFLTRHHFRPKNRRKVHFVQDTQGSSNESPRAVRASAHSHEVTEIERPASVPTSSRHPKSKRQKSAFSNRTSSPLLSGDLSGTNIKLPSFRRTSAPPESPFENWSKVKKGNAVLTSNPYKQSSDPEPRITESGQVVAKSSSNSTSKSMAQKSKEPPLLSSTGKIIRRPFADVESATFPRTLTNSTSATKQVQSSPQNQMPLIDHSGDDEIVEWINPTTKVKSWVNRRTGHTVLARPQSKSSLSYRPLLSEGPAFSRSNIQTAIDTSTDEPSPWLKRLLEKWDNPVFASAQLSIPQVSIDEFAETTRHMIHGHQHVCTQIDIDRALKDSSRINGRISKQALRNAEVISQVDNKFILVKLNNSHSNASRPDENEILVIIDQHAADERIRIENLLEELCSPNPNGSEAGILTTALEKPIHFEISSREIELLRTHRQHFSRWGILLALPPFGALPQHTEKSKGKTLQKITVTSLPPGITERCKSDPRLLIDLIRTEAWKCEEKPTIPSLPNENENANEKEEQPTWFKQIHTCPRGILDLLNSRACRSAIMFNDPLTREQCEGLVRALARCVFPFMCAHGRPSLVPLVGLGVGGLRFGEGGCGDRGVGEKRGFGEVFRVWRGCSLLCVRMDGRVWFLWLGWVLGV